jgi:hypothetical protein
MSLRRLILLVVIVVMIASTVAAQEGAPPAIVVLNVEGDMAFARADWNSAQPLRAGTLINTDDLVFPDKGAALLVMCPDGNVRDFVPGELLPNDVVYCPTDPASYVVGDVGTRHAIIQRGGRQDPAIPYLIAPRATLVRTSPVELRWNAVQDVEYYRVTVRGNGAHWQSDPLDPAEVVQGEEARLRMPSDLQEDMPYTVEICVLFEDMREGCTTDPGWSSTNVAFYFHPDPALDAAEERLIARLGADTPEALYARAVLFSQPAFETPSGMSPGYYDEAITFLLRITQEYPDSALARSPELYNLLGELCGRIALPLSAVRAYEQAAALAAPHTEASARAALGRALTTPAGDEVALYSISLEEYGTFLSEQAFTERFADICEQAGGLCLQFPQCEDRLSECARWARGDDE